ncbi:MAG TPA: FtsX-like permease family protein [Candidatus Dormibacteraeota bacterium]|nr:FtsX-like permease family protein [Candidatus Dormibacteraeota bacterium]
MPNPYANHSMFRRLVRRLLFANRGRLFVVLLALSAGAAVSAALLNLQTDAKRRINSEFRAFGSNVLILPKSSLSSADATFSESTAKEIPENSPGGRVTVSSAVYVAASVSLSQSGKPLSGIVAGIRPLAYLVARVVPPGADPTTPSQLNLPQGPVCISGQRIAARLGAEQNASLVITNGDRSESCTVVSLSRTGGPEDDRLEIDLHQAQRLADLPGHISAINLYVPGTPQQKADYVASLQKQFPDLDVRPLRQFTEAQAKIYSRISGLLTAATAIILVLTALCVMAAMTNIAAERKQDVGMMKAIGGSARGILNLFLTEAILLGLIGGLIGAAAGIALSMALGKAVFGVAALPRLIVYPISVALTVIVAILGAYPLRRLANVRPATIFRGEA